MLGGKPFSLEVSEDPTDLVTAAHVRLREGSRRYICGSASVSGGNVWTSEGNDGPEGLGAGGGIREGAAGRVCPAEGAAGQRSHPAPLLTLRDSCTEMSQEEAGPRRAAPCK